MWISEAELMIPMAKESRFVELTESIKHLMQQRSLADVSNLITRIYNDVRDLEADEGRGRPDPQMKEYAIDLWNWGVTKRGEEAITEMERAMVRHVSCNLACWCEDADQSEATIERNVLMAMKTGKGWIDVGKPEWATIFLETALNSLEKLYAMMTQRSAPETDVNLYKDCVEKEIFKVLTYQAEAAAAQKDFHTAAARIERCKEMLLRQPKQAAYLSVLCYNFGVETYEERRYEQSSFWLRQSYETGKADVLYSNRQEMQAKVLRLLATVYLEWDCKLYQDKALNAIKLANEEDLHPAGLYLKIKILLNCSLPDNVISMAASEMLRHKLSLDVYLNTVKLLMQHERDNVGFDFLNMICNQFESAPDIEKALLLQIELLTKRGKRLLARKRVEDLITGHYTGKPLSTETLSSLHVILWDSAAKSFENKDYSEALEWYNYSLGIYASDCTEPNFAKLQRNRASCFLHLSELSKAREAVTTAEENDPNNILTNFLLFKIAIQENCELEALNAVSTMGRLAAQTDYRTAVMDQYYSATDLLSLAAQIAMENNQQKVAVKALECVTEQSQDTQQVFLSLRCLVRMILSRVGSEDQDKRDPDSEILMSYLNLAHRKLAEHLAWDGLSDKRISEAHWFRKVAWNMAVGARESPVMMRDCFLLSYKISSFCPCDKTLLVAQRSCLLMAAAVDLELARKAADRSEQVNLLVHSLESISLCREIWNSLKAAGEFCNDNTEILLVLYEFEVRAKVNDPGLANVLDYVWELPNLDAKILESIAALSMEAPAYYPSISKKMLQGALSLLKKEESLDVSRLSKCLHSLLKLSLPERLMELEDCAQEEAWNYYQEALCIISTADYPETETLWLMSRAWNTGIFQYSMKKFPDAGRWCALAMRLLNYLGSLKSSYESKMAALYGDILDKLDKEKGSASDQ